MRSTTRCDACPHCGRPYPHIVIPGFLGVPERRILQRVCDCEGALEEELERRRRERQVQLRQAWGNTGVPKKYRDVKPDKGELEVIDSGRGIYVCGPKGTGKTRFACRILKAYVAKHTRDDGWCSARFISTSEWLDSLQETYGNRRLSTEDAFARAAAPDLLVLDDIGKVNSRVTDWTVGKLFRLIDERYGEERPTIFTSQYRLSELSGRLTVGEDVDTPDALVSRIFEMCEQRRFDGPDRRIENK